MPRHNRHNNCHSVSTFLLLPARYLTLFILVPSLSRCWIQCCCGAGNESVNGSISRTISRLSWLFPRHHMERTSWTGFYLQFLLFRLFTCSPWCVLRTYIFFLQISKHETNYISTKYKCSVFLVFFIVFSLFHSHLHRNAWETADHSFSKSAFFHFPLLLHYYKIRNTDIQTVEDSMW